MTDSFLYEVANFRAEFSEEHLDHLEECDECLDLFQEFAGEAHLF